MTEFENSWPANFNGPISRKVETQEVSKKHIKVADIKVYDTSLIYSRVVGIQASPREVDINKILNFELTPVPTSMFADTDELRIGKVSMRHTSSRISCLVVDGSAVIYTIHWPVNRTVNDYIDNFKSFIGQKLKQYDVYLVVDRYMSYITKSVTRSGRQSHVSKVYQLTCDMTIPTRCN